MDWGYGSWGRGCNPLSPCQFPSQNQLLKLLFDPLGFCVFHFLNTRKTELGSLCTGTSSPRREVGSACCCIQQIDLSPVFLCQQLNKNQTNVRQIKHLIFVAGIDTICSWQQYSHFVQKKGMNTVSELLSKAKPVAFKRLERASQQKCSDCEPI